MDAKRILAFLRQVMANNDHLKHFYPKYKGWGWV